MFLGWSILQLTIINCLLIKTSNYCTIAKKTVSHRESLRKKVIKRNLILLLILIKMYTTVDSIDVIFTKIKGRKKILTVFLLNFPYLMLLGWSMFLVHYIELCSYYKTFSFILCLHYSKMQSTQANKSNYTAEMKKVKQ